MNEHEGRDWLSAYLDGALAPEERSRAQAHLSGCSECRSELEALRAIKRRLASAPRRALPPDLLAELEADWAGTPSGARVWAAVLRQAGARRWAPAAAAAVLVLALWFGLHRHAGEEELPIELLAAAHSRYSAEGLIPGDMVASNFSAELARYQNNED